MRCQNAESTPLGASTANGNLLALPAGDGPWRITRYALLQSSSWSPQILGSSTGIKDSNLGSVVIEAQGEWPRTKAFSDAAKMLTFESWKSRDHPKRSCREADTLMLAEARYDDSGVGHQLWDSAIVLALYLRSSAMPCCFLGKRVLELGAGIGLPGIYLASRNLPESITLTDCKERLLTLLQSNAKNLEGSKTDVAKLDWTDPHDLSKFASTLPGHDYDIIIASDVCYCEEQVEPLANAICTLRVPVTLIVAPAGRQAAVLLSRRLQSSEVRVSTQHLALSKSDAECENASVHEETFLIIAAVRH
jgi:predicted nicotinamide N-methyase